MAVASTSGQLESSTMACGSITRKTGKVTLSGLTDLGSTKVPSGMMRGMVRESTPGITAPNNTVDNGVMARKMAWGTCVTISTLSRRKDSGGATRLSNGYLWMMMTKVKMERASSVRTSSTGKTTLIKLTSLNQN